MKTENHQLQTLLELVILCFVLILLLFYKIYFLVTTRSAIAAVIGISAFTEAFSISTE